MLENEFSGVARFLTVYIKEAHPDDEWQMRANEKEGLIYDQPKSLEERLEIAREFVSRMDYKIEVAVDSIGNHADRAYAAWPERLYVIGADGKIAYKGGMGPQGFKVAEVEAWLRSM